MIVLEWIRFILGGGLLLCGLGTFIIEMIGVFRFRYVLNRMHAAATGDTLGIGFALLGLIVISGFNFTSLKLFLVIVFLWFSSPVSSHLIARLEAGTDEESGKHYREIRLDAPGNDTGGEQEGAAERVGKTLAEAEECEGPQSGEKVPAEADKPGEDTPERQRRRNQ